MAYLRDINKAFYSERRNKLIEHLNKIGTYSRQSSNTLYGKTRKIKIGDVVSESKFMTCGVSQGTVLSPWLCIINVVELSVLQNCGSLHSCADYTKLILILTGNTWKTTSPNSRKHFFKKLSNGPQTMTYH